MTSQAVQALDVMILCGGMGTRLQPSVSDRPKSMAILRGRPFLEWQLMSLRERGFKNIILCIGYRGECIRHYFGNGERLELRINYSEEYEAKGTGGAIRGGWLFVHTDPVLVMNGDSWCDVCMTQMVRFHEIHQAIGTLALTTVTDPQRFGQVVLGHGNEIVGFSEKGNAEPDGLINAGMYVFTHTFLESIPEQSCTSLEHDVFPHWIQKGLYGYAGKRKFFDIGTPASYAQAEQDFDYVFQLPHVKNHPVRQTV